jgi:hypothetical protein
MFYLLSVRNSRRQSLNKNNVLIQKVDFKSCASVIVVSYVFDFTDQLFTFLYLFSIFHSMSLKVYFMLNSYHRDVAHKVVARILVVSITQIGYISNYLHGLHFAAYSWYEWWM